MHLFVVVIVLISLIFRTDVKKREGAWIQVSDLVKRPIGSNCSGTGLGGGKEGKFVILDL